MIALQVPAGGAVTIRPRAAIHDTVAAIVKQAPYHREIARSMFDRLAQWIGDMISRLFQGFGGIPHGRVITTIAAAIVVALVAARVLYSARLRTEADNAAPRGRGRVISAGDPWREAEELAGSGRFTDAAHALYRATIAMLAMQGLVRLHDSKTSGDYARELRRRASVAHAPFRRFGQRYDRIIYGTGTCDEHEYASLRDDARAVFNVRESERAA